MDPIIVAVIGIVALVIGVLLGVALTRSRTGAMVEAAVERARGEAAAATAQAQAEAAAARSELERERGEHAKTRGELDDVRDELDEASDDRAKFSERANQVEPLERKLQAATTLLEHKNEEIRTRSGREAELGALLRSEQEAHGLLKRQHEELTEANARTSIDLGNLRELHGQTGAKLKAEEEAHAAARAERDAHKVRADNAERQLADLRESNGGTVTALENERTAHGATRLELGEEKQARAALQVALAERDAQLAELNAKLEGEQKQAVEKLELLTKAREELSNQFKAVASDILDEKSKKFTEQNQTNIGQLLGPLAQQITEFKAKVEEVYVQEGKDRTELATHIRTLKDLNQTLSKDAQNLATALKGQVKTQGNWGEVVLEQLLQNAGLERGVHYEVQESHVREDGTRAQPDFVLKLPNDHHMVLDSKVTLVAYTRHVAAATDEERETARKEHCTSVRAHIRGLSEKNYQKLYNLKSLDCVVMFMPVEPAFTLAMGTDDSLFQEAWDRNIILCSNSTLLFALRTVAFLWTQEKQNRNAQEIASKGADLLDKLYLFAQEFDSLGTKLQQATKHYDVALGRLSSGNANVLRQANALVKLGVKPTKTLPKTMQEAVAAAEDSVALPRLDAIDVQVMEQLPEAEAAPGIGGPPQSEQPEQPHA